MAARNEVESNILLVYASLATISQRLVGKISTNLRHENAMFQGVPEQV
jgi:hypothetical protein